MVAAPHADDHARHLRAGIVLTSVVIAIVFRLDAKAGVDHILLGFAALLAQTQPPGGNLNAALLQFVSDRYPSWMVGLLAGTGFLLALAPGSLLLTAGSIFTRNVVRPFRSGLSERASLALSRGSLVVFAAIAVWLSVSQKGSLVKILLDAYSAIGMLAPGVFLGFLWKRTSAIGVLAGLVAGFVALLAPFAAKFWATTVPQWEAGLIAMAINAAVVVTVSLVTKAPQPKAVALGLQDDSPPDAAQVGALASLRSSHTL
jgi:SSS family solute:Na+ symporter